MELFPGRVDVVIFKFKFVYLWSSYTRHGRKVYFNVEEEMVRLDLGPKGLSNYGWIVVGFFNSHGSYLERDIGKEMVYGCVFPFQDIKP